MRSLAPSDCTCSNCAAWRSLRRADDRVVHRSALPCANFPLADRGLTAAKQGRTGFYHTRSLYDPSRVMTLPKSRYERRAYVAACLRKLRNGDYKQ